MSKRWILDTTATLESTVFMILQCAAVCHYSFVLMISQLATLQTIHIPTAAIPTQDISTGECFLFFSGKELFVCSQSGCDHPDEDVEKSDDRPQEEELAKSGYNNHTRYEMQNIFIILIFLAAQSENQIQKFGQKQKKRLILA